MVSVLLLLILLTGPAWATEYFISTTGSDANNGLTEGTAWATLTKAFGGTGMSGGDTLTILSGTYDFAFGHSVEAPNGTSAAARTVIRAKPITRTCVGDNVAYPAEACWASTYEPVIFTGRAGANDCRIRFHGTKQWIVVEGIILDGANGGADFGICVACDGSFGTNPPTCDAGVTATCPADLRFLNMTVKNFTNSSGLIGFLHERVEVLHSKITRNGSLVTNKDHGMYWSGIDGGVAGNELWENGGIGIQVYRNPPQPTCFPKGTGMLVERNYFHHNGLSGAYLGGWTESTTFRNNVSVQNGGTGVTLASGSTGGHSVLNNTLMHNGNRGLIIRAGGDNAIIRNNVYSGLSQDAGATGLTMSNNYDACRGTTPCAEPLFVNPAIGDYRLQSSDTLLLNQGLDLTSVGVVEDFAGIARPQGAAFDIGAHEFLAGTTAFDFALSDNIVEDEDPVIIQGQSTQVIITATTLAGTASAVTFAATNLPAGVSVSFSVGSCTPTTPCTTTATIQTANATPEGGFTITIEGKAGGITRRQGVPIVVVCD